MKKYDPLLIVRALACISIVWRHSYPGLSVWFMGNDLTYLFIPNTSVSVFLFYFLSAYGIGYGFSSGKYSLNASSIVKFYKNRILRIVPLYYFLLLITPFLFYVRNPLTAKDYFRLATFTATSATDLSAYRAWGIVSTEMQFYLVAPLLVFVIYKLLKKIPISAAIILSMAFGTLLRLFFYLRGLHTDGEYIDTVFTTVAGNIDIFLIGLLIGLYMVKNQFSISRNYKILLSCILIILFFPWYIWSGKLQYMIGIGDWFPSWRNQMLFLLPLTTELFAAALTVVTAKVVTTSPYMKKPIEVLKNLVRPNGILYAIGVFSYGIYLWHAPVADAVYNRIGTPFGTIPTLWRFSIVLLLALIFSIGTYMLIEIPFLKLGKRKTDEEKAG